MTLAFELLRDNPSSEFLSQSFKIVSLWDMIKFHVQGFIEVCQYLAEASRAVREWQLTGQEPSEYPKLADGLLVMLPTTLTNLGLPCSSKSANTLIRYMTDKSLPWDYNQFKQYLDEL